ncbi:MAG: VanZ family protein [Candidatus Fimenecus sp.]
MTAKRKAYIVLSWTAVALCMGFIFYMSSNNGDESKALSDSLAQKLISFFGINIPKAFLRKCAHFTEFAGLGLFLFNALYASFGHRLTPLFALGGSVIYAISDEVHQIFSDGRACRFTDILIDSAGALSGIVIAFLVLKIIRRSKNGSTETL